MAEVVLSACYQFTCYSTSHLDQCTCSVTSLVASVLSPLSTSRQQDRAAPRGKATRVSLAPDSLLLLLLSIFVRSNLGQHHVCETCWWRSVAEGWAVSKLVPHTAGSIASQDSFLVDRGIIT